MSFEEAHHRCIFITKGFVNGARSPFCFAGTGKYAISFKASFAILSIE